MFLKSLEYSSSALMVEGDIVLSVDAKIIYVDLQPFLS